MLNTKDKKEQEAEDRGGDYFECCKCSEYKLYDEFAVHHAPGEDECISCYAESMNISIIIGHMPMKCGVHQ